jgi:hypothetical protein
MPWYKFRPTSLFFYAGFIMDATNRQRDHLKRFGVRTIPKNLTVAAASRWIDKLYEEEIDVLRDDRMGLNVWILAQCKTPVHGGGSPTPLYPVKSVGPFEPTSSEPP